MIAGTLASQEEGFVWLGLRPCAAACGDAAFEIGR